MLSAALTSFTTFFATVGPIEAAVIFATLTPGVAVIERRRIAVRATLIASTILLGSTLAGGPLLKQLGEQIEKGQPVAIAGMSEADWESSLPPDQQKQVQDYRQYEASAPTMDPDAAARNYMQAPTGAN